MSTGGTGLGLGGHTALCIRPVLQLPAKHICCSRGVKQFLVLINRVALTAQG